MVVNYTGIWNGFQIRSPAYLGKHKEDYRFDIVKWQEHNPIEATDLETGEKAIHTKSCFSVGFLTWNQDEESFEFESVGTRFLENYVDGLSEWILKFCEDVRKEI